VDRKKGTCHVRGNFCLPKLADTKFQANFPTGQSTPLFTWNRLTPTFPLAPKKPFPRSNQTFYGSFNATFTRAKFGVNEIRGANWEPTTLCASNSSSTWPREIISAMFIGLGLRARNVTKCSQKILSEAYPDYGAVESSEIIRYPLKRIKNLDPQTVIPRGMQLNA
jgi:hypothetical protein